MGRDEGCIMSYRHVAFIVKEDEIYRLYVQEAA